MFYASHTKIKLCCTIALAVPFTLLVLSSCSSTYKLETSREDIKTTNPQHDSAAGGSHLPDFSKARRVLILTYTRSGSTFLGELFNQNKRSIYWFEPLRTYMAEFYKTDRLLREKHLNFVELKTREDVLMEGGKTLASILRCNFTFGTLPGSIKNNDTTLITAHELLSGSVGGKPVLRGNQKPSTRDYDALHSLQEICQKMDIAALKTVRLSVKAARDMMKRDNNLFLIYLTRDPRASANSRMKLWWSTFDNYHVVSGARSACKQMADDYGNFQTLHEAYPGRSLHIRYEDLATEPHLYSRQIYEMLGYKTLPSHLHEWIANNTNGQGSSEVKHTKQYEYSTNRNASAVVHKWRSEMSKEMQIQIQQVCNTLLNLLNY